LTTNNTVKYTQHEVTILLLTFFSLANLANF